MKKIFGALLLCFFIVSSYASHYIIVLHSGKTTITQAQNAQNLYELSLKKPEITYLVFGPHARATRMATQKFVGLINQKPGAFVAGLNSKSSNHSEDKSTFIKMSHLKYNTWTNTLHLVAAPVSNKGQSLKNASLPYTVLFISQA